MISAKDFPARPIKLIVPFFVLYFVRLFDNNKLWMVHQVNQKDEVDVT